MSQPPPENPPPENQPPGGYPPGNQPPGGYPPGNQPPGGYPPGNQPPAGPAYGGYGGAPPRKPSKGMAVVALVFGILALLFCWTVVGGILFGLIALIVGLVASGKAKRGTAGGRGLAITGIVLGLLGALVSVAIIAFGAWLFGDAQNLQDCLEQAGSNQSEIDQCRQQFEDDLQDKLGG